MIAPWRVVAVASILSALGPAPARAQSSRTPAVAQDERTVEHTLFRLENDWAAAVIHRDVAALQRLVAPHWVYSDESGVMERDAGIRSFTTGTDTVRAASNNGMRVFVYPGSAVVIGVLQMRGNGPSGPFVHRYRYTDTWAWLDGRWQCVASQDYLIPERQHAARHG